MTDEQTIKRLLYRSPIDGWTVVSNAVSHDILNASGDVVAQCRRRDDADAIVLALRTLRSLSDD